jgi:flagellar protein FlbD
MIEITRINGQPMVLNCDLIESIEAAPDTIIRLTSGKTIVIKESVKELVERVVAFKRRVLGLNVSAPDEAFEEVRS